MIDTSRLLHVADVCLLARSPHRWLFATRWMAAIARSAEPIIFNENGHTVTVVANRFLTWRRTFTNASVSPACDPSASWITLHEWCPSFRTNDMRGWLRFGIPHREALVFLDEPLPWSSHARRHMKKSHDVNLRIGTVEIFEKNIKKSHIPSHIQRIAVTEVHRHMTAHPETIEFLIAESPEGELLACFVVGMINEARQSYYIAGFFTRGTEKLYAKTALVDWWFRRSREQCLITLNFGHIVGPSFLDRLESGAGYSNFKTHFGVRRVWWPGNFWKIVFQNKLKKIRAIDT